MSDLLNASTAQANDVTHDPRSEPQSLRCQWCSVPLAAGVTVCPTCGSPGIPDPRMTVPALTDLEASEPDPVREAIVGGAAPAEETELVEWWLNDSADEAAGVAASRGTDLDDVERRRMQSIIFMGGAVLVCAMLGWLIGPSLLVAPFEGLTGTTVENSSDLRGMGTLGGLVAGMFIGATGGWVIWSGR